MLILANAAIPVFLVAAPWMVWLFPAVIVLEAAVAKKDLALRWHSTLVPLIVANLASALVGAALLYGLTFGGAALLDRSAATKEAVFLLWLYPGATNFAYSSAVMTGYFIVCLIISVFIEKKIVARSWISVSEAALRKYEWKIHIISYSAMIALWLVLMFHLAQEK